MRFETILIGNIPQYEKYAGTVVEKIKYIVEDDLDEDVSRMILVRLVDGRIIPVFEDETEEVMKVG